MIAKNIFSCFRVVDVPANSSIEAFLLQEIVSNTAGGGGGGGGNVTIVGDTVGLAKEITQTDIANYLSNIAVLLTDINDNALNNILLAINDIQSYLIVNYYTQILSVSNIKTIKSCNKCVIRIDSIQLLLTYDVEVNIGVWTKIGVIDNNTQYMVIDMPITSIRIVPQGGAFIGEVLYINAKN